MVQWVHWDLPFQDFAFAILKCRKFYLSNIPSHYLGLNNIKRNMELNTARNFCTAFCHEGIHFRKIVIIKILSLEYLNCKQEKAPSDTPQQMYYSIS